MLDIIRDAPLGQIIRWTTKNKVLLYPEERADFTCPASYTETDGSLQRQNDATRSSSPASTTKSTEDAADAEKAAEDPTRPDGSSEPEDNAANPDRDTLGHIEPRASNDLTKQTSKPIVPEQTTDGTILVTWYTTDDPDNPQNWSQGKKALAAIQVYLYTTGFYMGSAIYTPSETPIINIFGVSQEVASLGLALYVLAYGLGPLLFSPLSEVPSIGRNPPYMIGFGLFVILCIPAALVTNVPGLLVLRFLQGFFGSPAISTGGASIGDLYSLIKMPYGLTLWAFAATCGPALGPLISGYSVPAESWHWSLWEMLWLAAPIYVSMFMLLPETFADNILLRRARRLRALTGNSQLKSQSEIRQANMTPRAVAFEALVRPFQLMILDPAIGFTAGYIALMYGIYYSFFESFPLVYIDIYHFNVGEMGLTFLSITVGSLIAIAAYWAYLWWIVEPEILKKGLGAPERRLIPALPISFLVPISLFMFGWTAQKGIPWIVSVIAIMLFTIAIFILVQCIFAYLPMVYPQYVASLLAGNAATRSSLAFAAVLFGDPLYDNLGIGRGSSLLGGLTVAGIIGIWVLYFYGGKLRARSRFSMK